MEDFQFNWMTINRIVAHTIHQRGNDKVMIEPTYADGLLIVDNDSRDLIQVRVTGALTSSSHGVEMAINKRDSGSFMQIAAKIMSTNDALFFEQSKVLAKKLAEAQTNSKWPGGVLIVLSGTVGSTSKPFLCVIKAETDKGFNLVETDGKISLTLMKKMLLSATQRLYKVGLLVQITAGQPDEDGLFDVNNYRAFLFDHLLTATETRNAAAYFYDAFLGMNIHASSRKQTEMFFLETKNFINNANINDVTKNTLREALRTELKSQTPTLNATDFAEKHLEDEMRESYLGFLQQKGFPEHSVVKDIDYIKHKLRRPRLVLFTSGISIRVPSSIEYANSISISEGKDGFTNVSIRGTVESQD